MSVALKEMPKPAKRVSNVIPFRQIAVEFAIDGAAINVIEFVCYANSVRSPICELVAKNYLMQIGEAGHYIAVSSGTNVTDIASKNYPFDFYSRVLDQGRERGFYTRHELIKIEVALADHSKAVLEPYFHRALDIFADEERVWRQQVLEELGIEGKLKSYKDQVIAVPDRIAVLTMSENGLRHVSGMYDKTDFRPDVLDILSRFATGDQDAIVHDSFGKTKDEYIKTVQDLMRYVPMAVDKVVMMTSRQ